MNYAAVGDPETHTRIEQFELAFRMQAEMPKVMDLTHDESGAQALYGVGTAGTPSNSNTNNTSAVLAKFTSPAATRVGTFASRVRFRGMADPSRGAAVYLMNSRLNRILVPATGLGRWNCVLPLRYGRNAIHLFVETNDGFRQRVDRRIVIRQRP